MASMIEVNDSNAQQMLNGLLSRMQSDQPAMQTIADTLAERTRATWSDQQDPYGSPWAELSARTIARRRKGDGSGKVQILRDTGQLSQTVEARGEIGAAIVTVGGGPANRYATTHQFGIAERNIPQRKMLPLDNDGQTKTAVVNLPTEWIEELVDIFSDHVIA